MLSASEKFNKARRLSAVLAEIKLLEVEKSDLVATLTEYVEETGDTIFQWPNAAIRLTYVKGSPAKDTVDAKAFMELAKKYMTADDYSTCIAKATKKSGGRKASFR